MTFITALFLAIIFLCFGGILGCFFCVCIGKVFNRRYLKTRTTIIFVLLSILVATSSVFFVFFYNKNIEIDIIFLFVNFVIGFLCITLWKFFLPLFVLLYVVISALTGICLYKKFTHNTDRLSVIVYDNYLKVEDKTIYLDNVEEKAFVVNVYNLPSVLLAPLPRVWYEVVGVTSLQHVQGDNFVENSTFIALKENQVSEKKWFWSEQFEKYMNWVLGDKSKLLVNIPTSDYYPISIDLVFLQQNERLTCKVVNSL